MIRLSTILLITLPLLTAAPTLSRESPAEASAQSQEIVDPMDMAVSLAKGKYRSWIYKTKSEPKSIDCTEFVLDVVNSFAKVKKTKLTSAQRNIVTVNNLKKGADLQALVEKSDKQIRGVQTALIDAGLGTEVKPEDAMLGDLVQYWYKDKGKWKGHAGVVEQVAKNGKKVTLSIFGSHKTSLRERADGEKDTKAGGIGSGPRLVLPSDNFKVFIVRWTDKK